MKEHNDTPNNETQPASEIAREAAKSVLRMFGGDFYCEGTLARAAAPIQAAITRATAANEERVRELETWKAMAAEKLGELGRELAAAKEEIERVTQLLGDANALADHNGKEVEKRNADKQRLQAENATLREDKRRMSEALKPFAVLARCFEEEIATRPQIVAPSHGSYVGLDNRPITAAITFGHLAAATAATQEGAR